MPDLSYDHFYRFDELTSLLHAFSQEYPQLIRLESIGQSWEGRDIWLLRVTNFDLGPDTVKPGLWIDGNIHATELAASTACLYFLNHLVTGYGCDPNITRCLDRRTFYLCPRLNPDGAELALADRPQILRSGTRPYPQRPIDLPGLQEADIDGDGRILLMRIPDPNGLWKISEQDARLLIRREPTEIGGHYYRVLPEGFLDEEDPDIIHIQPPIAGLDFNRNFPSDWRPEQEQLGAGDYPTSEPEVRAVVHFISQQRNLTGAISFHTYSGVLLRPYSHKPDEAFPTEDLRVYQYLGRQGHQQTGYPACSAFHDFRYDPKETVSGVFDDWAYDQQGMFSWTVEIWSPQRAAGIEHYDWIDWFREHPIEDDLKLLRWNDQALTGQGFVDWHPFDHPQLGWVELGGWDHLHTFRNPPFSVLEAEVARFPDWLVWHLLIAPELGIRRATAESLGENLWHVTLVLENRGWLPTFVTHKAVERKLLRPIIAELELPEGVQLIQGDRQQDLGQLEGRASKGVIPASDPTTDRAKASWIVQAALGTDLRISAQHDRGGQVKTIITLGKATVSPLHQS
jgi:murein tripeptide amidase MpaA